MKLLSVTGLLLGSALASYGQTLPDSTAIKQVLERESATWRAGDVAGHTQCWQVRPYSRILISTGDGKVLDVPPAFMVSPPPNTMGKGGAAVNSHYQMSIQGNAAWVSHDEVSTAKDGTKSYSSEVRMLEKIGGQWKLVGQSIHVAGKK
ncbi:endo-arabinase [Hymenobacter sp. RP-2-7]|uniref:Endo-arabinase n=1 Tax=Hymenobacter polaris TaxID=2682546 RepID=A0A7Y0FMB5_9BACT|nr:endo-arabinase [Hymenobacter polaris]NML65249.1 endo-arabinase [Hymenobacter polaris]